MFVFILFQVFLDFQASQVALDLLVRRLGRMFEDLQETLAYLGLMGNMVNTSPLITFLYLCILLLRFLYMITYQSCSFHYRFPRSSRTSRPAWSRHSSRRQR